MAPVHLRFLGFAIMCSKTFRLVERDFEKWKTKSNVSILLGAVLLFTLFLGKRKNFTKSRINYYTKGKVLLVLICFLL